MPTLHDVLNFLERRAPLHLAEEWDNVGLLIGSRERNAARVMTCLTLTGEVAAEAVERGANLVVTHHPLPFHPLQRITDHEAAGRVVLALIEARIAVYSAHTAFDSTADGINEMWAHALRLGDLEPLVPNNELPSVGAGRIGNLAVAKPLAELAELVKGIVNSEELRGVGREEASVTRIAIACGSGGSLIEAAAAAGAELLLTGEASFHGCLAAAAHGMALFLTGHYASERFAMERLAEELAEAFPEVEAWASRAEADPLRQW